MELNRHERLTEILGTDYLTTTVRDERTALDMACTWMAMGHDATYWRNGDGTASIAWGRKGTVNA